MVDSPPKIVLHPVDLHEDLVEMPAPMPEMTHRLHPAASDLGSENRPEAVPPEPHGLVRDVDAALMEQVLDIPELERNPT
jgi:hypothetical protein